MLYAVWELATHQRGVGIVVPHYLLYFCAKFEILKIFVWVVIKPDVDSALGSVVPTEKLFLDQIHTWGSFLTYLTLIQTTFKILLCTNI